VGKLAERLSDPARSGVYRIEATEAVEEAAALNRYALLRVRVDGCVKPALEPVTRGANRVIVVSGFERLARERPGEMRAWLEDLDRAAQAWRPSGARVFIAFLDPAQALPQLLPLYNWQRSRSAAQATGAERPNCSASRPSPRSSTK